MRKMTKGQRIFNYMNSIFLSLLGLSMVLPLINIIAQSFSSSAAINTGAVSLWPVDATLSNYKVIVGDSLIWRSFLNSVIITVVGTLINLAATATLAYPLSRQEYLFRKPVLIMVLCTMIFSAPLIPNFLVIRELGLLDSLWALMLPMSIGAFHLFIMRSFFMSLPSELIDSSRIDGCGELGILWKIVLPLSKPALATLAIMYSVAHWNRYAEAIYFIRDRNLIPLQVRLREVVFQNQFEDPTNYMMLQTISPEGVKMAVIVVGTIPIILVYPFLQKYFVKGMLLGSVKS
ncbi:ABC transporter permease [Paenibacillus agaridevorans]|uniref:ABC transporter permease n=1 Tax=Paenibacillus agaridevorans TaxID=171404 RepID=A0A2R5EZW7_9BACL|nr:carbohydrate ABC transporter permease [Paenibacillus agaridevorans]GBG08931.1 ABC transporter permease [Paenibacillus agaridevorans]